MAYNVSHKLRDNITAIKLALRAKDGEKLGPEAIEQLKRYSGFGGIKAILYPYAGKEEWISKGATQQDLKLYEDIMQLHELLEKTKDVTFYRSAISSVQNSVLTSFYTPDMVVKILFDAIKGTGVEPKKLYEPSAGAGAFVTGAIDQFSTLNQITAVEKDILTGLVLQAINSQNKVDTNTLISAFEETNNEENEKYDLVASNIPFGNFSVYDPQYPQKELSGKIHNYFFVKGLDKLADGGLLAYITNDAFLNSPSNAEARQYLFAKADFVSLSIMPDNLMQDTGNTLAPSHLLIVQKNSNKQELSEGEQLLVTTSSATNEHGEYFTNSYIPKAQNDYLYMGTPVAGTNQYGNANTSVSAFDDVEYFKDKLAERIKVDLYGHFNAERFATSLGKGVNNLPTKKLTFVAAPVDKQSDAPVQLGLFDNMASDIPNRALAYLTEADLLVVQPNSASIASVISTKEMPGHETAVLIAAREQGSKKFIYKLYANAAEIVLSSKWLNADLLQKELLHLNENLAEYNHEFTYKGDYALKSFFEFGKAQPETYDQLLPHYKNGTLVVHQGKLGALTDVDQDHGKATFHAHLSQQSTQFYTDYIALRDQYIHFSDKEVSGYSSSEEERSNLNVAYDRFVERYGLLNFPANRKKIAEDEAFGLQIVSSLERRDGDRFLKSDILTQSLKASNEVFQTDNPGEALALCLNECGYVDLHFISTTLSVEQEDAIKELGDLIYLNPQTNEWETADQYLSGNVVEKMGIAKELSESQPQNFQYQRSFEAIQKVQPEKIPFELLDFNLGERWIPTNIYERYATELFETDVQIGYFQSIDTFKVDALQNLKVSHEFAVQPKSGKKTYGYTLLEHALENTTPFYTYEVSLGDDKTIRVPDNEAIQLAHQKIEQIRSGFIDWLHSLSEEEKNSLTDKYNSTFNCYRLREYDGSHLTFPGLDRKALGIKDLYSSQKDASWRTIQNRGALIDHEVGLGKTLTMIVTAQEMKRLGIIKKPLIMAMKANVLQIRDTYRKAYPNARILAPDEKDFSPIKRLRLFHEIKNNNWDCIILTHDQFGKIPQSPEVQEEILQEELNNVERDLETAEELDGEISKRILKGLEIRKSNLSNKLQKVEHDIAKKKDDGIDFRQMGIDHLFIDEAHHFKNLTFTTRHSRVAGLGNTEGSQRALNMLFAVRTLQRAFGKDLCATFLSGTPISNSLTELYLLYKYLRPNELKRQGIENFDGWAAVFARKTTDFEFSVTNQIIAKERFRHFIKVPELALFYNEITDYKTAKHINLDKPELVETLVNIKPSQQQQDFIKKLMAFAQTGDGTLIGRGKLSPEEDKGRMLIATNYAKKMAVDMRLINEAYDDDPDNKVNNCARQLVEIYKESMEHKGTQIVFCDIGTPKDNEFNIYDALRDKLVRDFDIPRAEIAFVHEWEKKKNELFQKMNSGSIRILIGSTQKAGTGLNVQERVVAMHHLDIPWKPSEFEQRNGRGARQGNIIAKLYYGNKVRNFIYATEQSLDNYKFNLLKNKQTFILQMKNSELNIRIIDEGAMDEQSGMNFSEYIAILSGDTSLLEKTKIEKKVAVVEGLKTSHFRETAKFKSKLEQLKKDYAIDISILENLKEDEKSYSAKLTYTEDGIKANPIQLIGIKSSDSEQIGNHIISLYRSWKPKVKGETTEKIGSLYGFNLYVKSQEHPYERNGVIDYITSNSFYAQRQDNPDGIKYTSNGGMPNLDNPKLTARYFLNAIDRVEALRQKYQKEVAEIESEIPKMEALATKPFTKDHELQQLKTELSNIEREIAIKIQERQMKDYGKEETSEEKEVEDIVEELVDTEHKIVPIENNKYQLQAMADMRRNKRFRVKGW